MNPEERNTLLYFIRNVSRGIINYLWSGNKKDNLKSSRDSPKLSSPHLTVNIITPLAMM